MKKEMSIPKADLDAINKSFERSKSAQIITKNFNGSRLSSGMKVVNPRGFEIESFGGRTLKHAKEVVTPEGEQILIGIRGQRWDDIPESLRGLVVWFDSDFLK